MRLTEQSRYALRVLAHCAERHPALAKVATIADVTGITEQNIFKLIKALTKAGLVQTIRGPHGGVRLAMAPGAIRVGQVIRSIEPRFKACGPLDQMLSEEPVGAIDRELDRTIGLGIAAFMETLDRTSIAALIVKTTAGECGLSGSLGRRRFRPVGDDARRAHRSPPRGSAGRRQARREKISRTSNRAGASRSATGPAWSAIARSRAASGSRTSIGCPVSSMPVT